MARRKPPVIPDQLLDPLLSGADANTTLEKDGLLDGLKKALPTGFERRDRSLNLELPKRTVQQPKPTRGAYSLFLNLLTRNKKAGDISSPVFFPQPVSLSETDRRTLPSR